ncbi:MAG: hypothetical protein HPY71_13560 [Firmicutes bacterium]|nr:hypothetical protein [Bacillota bacterium]
MANLDVSEISLVDRAANKRRFLFFKSKGGEQAVNPKANLDELEDEMVEEEGVGEEIEKAIDEKKLKSAIEALVNALSKVELPDKAAKALAKLTELAGLEYGYGYGYPEPKKAKTEKGILEKIKDLIFQHEGGRSVDAAVVDSVSNVKKADKNLEAAFETSVKVNDISNAVWQLQDVIRDILRDNEANKIERIKANLDAFQAFVVKILEKDGVEKALESLEKVGKKISTARLAKLKETHGNLIQLANVLAELIQEAEGSIEERGTDVTKEEMDKAMADGIKQALAPIEERIAKLEKAGEEITKSVEESIKKAVDPLTARVETIEKARSVSQSIPNEVQKANTGTFSGVIFGRKP